MYVCSKCGNKCSYLLEGGLGKCCYVAGEVGALPVKEKRSFSKDANATRRQARGQKMKCRKIGLISKKNEKRGVFVVCIGRRYFDYLYAEGEVYPRSLDGALKFRFEKTAMKWAEKTGGKVKELHR